MGFGREARRVLDEMTFGSLSVAGADDETRSPADNALFFETAEGNAPTQTLKRNSTTSPSCIT